MSRKPFSLFFFAVLVFTPGCTSKKEPPPAPDLVIYTNESFAAKNGLGPAIVPLYEKKCQCRVEAIAVGDSAQILSRLELDARNKQSQRATAQLVVGLDQQLFERSKTFLESWGAWIPQRYERISGDLKLGSGFLPYDYGLMTFMANQQMLRARKLVAPRRLRDLMDPEWKRSLLLEDPRTSTPGLLFLLYTEAALGKDVWKFWKELKYQWLTLAPGWSGAYGLFLKGEAPLVWSYFTSQAYHRNHGDASGTFEALVFEDGHPLQIEGAAMVKGAAFSDRQKLLALGFLEFLISDEVQRLIPHANWMMPAVTETQLPADFQSLPKVERRLQLTQTPAETEELLKHWAGVASAPK